MRFFAVHRIAAVRRPTRCGGDRAKLPGMLTFVAAVSIPRVHPDADFESSIGGDGEGVQDSRHPARYDTVTRALPVPHISLLDL